MRVKVIDRDGIEHEVEGATGAKLMEVLRDADLGIAAICGGMCSCGTCHVYVDPAWTGRLPAAMSDERDLLEILSPRECSRLSCQIRLTADLDGLQVTIAPEE